ncbi:3-methyl-2-oxobutanoate hydroxymethyltransferase [Propionivibrio dicarboxylicus]|uniref:3-methyl-2-oxobutanoate hydroxymethyltransferase n=1 Tax=Propionivibrio dicarboxylicus TaxID=83767 RepID=A0A1G8MAG7_9RHOO|nr:3-methyl-2-oxobutanoate hydroxymethyltransferase [Propionivibrio dicarboxylicus]SDI64360.1 3-methyl-2-oxobutanoate hydroxymethyltransferase [Propionivibrio dicarboxylicus]
MSAQTTSRRLTHLDLAKMRAAGEKIAMLTCYDASFARACDAAGIESILIGDSLGMVVQGQDSTLPVTVEDIAYHTRAVVRGCRRPLIIADLPFGSYQESPQVAYRNAVTLMAAGAQMVKLEGGVDMAETTRFLTARGIPVCAHVGLTPQSVHQLGGYRVQGKDDAGAAQLMADSLAQQDAGATLIVLEAIPAALAAEVTAKLVIPTIGIGAGKDCSGQVLVLHDMLDVASGRVPRFVRNFLAGQNSIVGAFSAYSAAVKDGSFPAPEHCY